MYADVFESPGPPLRYTIDRGAGLLVIEPLSIENPSSLLAALRDITSDLRYRSSLDVCVDCNSLRRVPSCDQLKQLARFCVAHPRGEAPSRWAFVATWRPINEAARFFATAISAPNVALRVFETWSDAHVWLSATRPVTHQEVPWVGPSRALNELMQRSRRSS